MTLLLAGSPVYARLGHVSPSRYLPLDTPWSAAYKLSMLPATLPDGEPEVAALIRSVVYLISFSGSV